MRYYFLILCFLIISEVKGQIGIDTTFEGANIKILNINNTDNVITAEPNLRRGDVYKVSFYFRILNADTTRVTKIRISYMQDYFISEYAAYSYDKINWYRTNGIKIGGNIKEYSVLFNRKQVYFSHAYPYTYSSLIDYLSGLSSSYLNIINVSVSEFGRNVKLVKITNNNISDTGKQLIWITGRQHCMEAHTNYIVEGIINFLLSGDLKAQYIRDKAIIYIVPLVDVDMAALGGTGKDQMPVDFNRDWDSPSYWNAVRDIKIKVRQTALLNNFRLFIDVHSPFPGDADTTNRFFAYSLYSGGIKSINLNRFRSFFTQNSGYYMGRKVMYPVAGQTASIWMDSTFSNIDFALSTETGWVSRPDNMMWNITYYRMHGGNIGKAISDYVNYTIGINDDEKVLRNQVSYYKLGADIMQRFALAKGMECGYEIFDVAGRMIRRFKYGYLAAGTYDYRISTNGLSSGIYFIKLKTVKDFTNKILIIK